MTVPEALVVSYCQPATGILDGTDARVRSRKLLDQSHGLAGLVVIDNRGLSVLARLRYDDVVQGRKISGSVVRRNDKRHERPVRLGCPPFTLKIG